MKQIILIIIIFIVVVVIFQLRKSAKSSLFEELPFIQQSDVIASTTTSVPPVTYTSQILRYQEFYLKKEILKLDNGSSFEKSIATISSILFENATIKQIEQNENLYIFEVTQSEKNFYLIVFNQNKKILSFCYPIAAILLQHLTTKPLKQLQGTTSLKDFPIFHFNPATLQLHNFIRYKR